MAGVIHIILLTSSLLALTSGALVPDTQTTNKPHSYNIRDLGRAIDEFAACSIVIHIPLPGQEHYDLSEIRHPFKLTSPVAREALYIDQIKLLVVPRHKTWCIVKFILLVGDVGGGGVEQMERDGQNLFRWNYHGYPTPDDATDRTTVVVTGVKQTLVDQLRSYPFIMIQDAAYSRIFVYHTHQIPQSSSTDCEITDLQLFLAVSIANPAETYHVNCTSINNAEPQLLNHSVIPCLGQMTQTYNEKSFNGKRLHFISPEYVPSGRSLARPRKVELPKMKSPFHQEECYLCKEVATEFGPSNTKAFQRVRLNRFALEAFHFTTDNPINTSHNPFDDVYHASMAAFHGIVQYDINKFHPDIPYFAVILTQGLEYTFVTCDGVQKNMSFQFYWKPFSIASWLCILVAMTTLALVLTTMTLSLLPAPRSWLMKIDLYIKNLFYILSTLLEVSPEVPRLVTSNRILRRAFNMGTIPWLLLALVFSNAYKGIVVTESTAPIPWKGSWESSKQMDGFVFFGETGRNLVPWVSSANWMGRNANVSVIFERDLCTCLKQGSCEKMVNKLKPFQLDTFIPNVFNTSHAWCKEKRGGPEMQYVLIEPATNDVKASQYANYNYHPNGSQSSEVTPAQMDLNVPFRYALVVQHLKYTHASMEMKVATCRKAAYIDVDEKVDGFLAHITLSSYAKGSRSRTGAGTGYIEGKEPVFTNLIGYAFKWPHKFIYQRYQALVASGIHDLYKKWYQIKYPTKDQQLMNNATKVRAREQGQPMSLSLDSNVRSLFEIYIFIVTFHIATIIAEILVVKYQRSRKTVLSGFWYMIVVMSQWISRGLSVLKRWYGNIIVNWVTDAETETGIGIRVTH